MYICNFVHICKNFLHVLTTFSFSPNLRNWIRSYIRCIVWHPNCFKIAVAGLDDIVRIYTDEPAIVPVLKVRFFDY